MKFKKKEKEEKEKKNCKSLFANSRIGKIYIFIFHPKEVNFFFLSQNYIRNQFNGEKKEELFREEDDSDRFTVTFFF